MSDLITDEMVEVALEGSYDPPKEPGRTFLNRDAYESMWAHHMRAALEAVAPLIAAKALRDFAELVMAPSRDLRDAATCRSIALDAATRADAIGRGES